MTEENTNLPATMEAFVPEVIDPDQFLTSTAAFNHIQRVAKLLAAADLVPTAYKKNIPNCVLAIQAAHRLKIDPFVLMQNSSIVNGKLGLDGKLITAALNTSGLIKDRIKFALSGEGDDRKCVASVVNKSGETLTAEVTVKMAKELGWYGKSQFWKSMTDQMLIYRSASFLAKAYFPDVTLGLQLADELNESVVEVRENGGSRVTKLLQEK